MKLKNKLLNSELNALDAELLLAHVLQKPREFLHMHPDTLLSSEQVAQFNTLEKKRKNNVPLAYLVNKKAFYGRDFFVNEKVHIPRPATEDAINYMREHVNSEFSGTIADVCTGSGCIAVTFAFLYPSAHIIATDISTEALAIAEQNAQTHGVHDRITFIAGNFLDPLPEQIAVIFSNPPYGWPQATRSLDEMGPQATRSLGEVWTTDPEVTHQPRISYESGIDGLDAIKEITATLPKKLTHDGHAFIEFDPRQATRLAALVPTGYKHSIHKDLAGFERILHITPLQ